MTAATMHRPLPTLNTTDPLGILRAGLAAAGGPVALACSFSVEDVALIDIAREAELEIGIFAIDTGRLNEETYQAAEAVRERYRVNIDWYFPQRQEVEKLEREKGLFSFYESLASRHECCHIRKVEPLARALAGLTGWITGLRREQSVTRGGIAPLEIDAAHGGILKVNPLVSWTEENCGPTPTPPTAGKPAAPPGLSLYRLRPLHPGDPGGGALPRRALVVGGPGAQRVRTASLGRCFLKIQEKFFHHPSVVKKRSCSERRLDYDRSGHPQLCNRSA